VAVDRGKALDTMITGVYVSQLTYRRHTFG